ncbi:hypothetical protein BDY17DRAFT_138259 [Neohortaea acidophila]|uniref:FAD dependent oxidoreductase domain-containing protein n=1 Tax=Neohortaea acidophila TaxID=245834 RepID=A0A6A6PS11_9PEZI|nr:uncharacterized protein BDY17DRAFT_138259 [Neohortaea acidophila]KAF2482918.1 hypothetical protein BDY17DRAFT_138259 [Neohortaea acidophila]
MPGDYDIEYCSPWAGADYSPSLATRQWMKISTSPSTSKEAVEEIGRRATALEQNTWPVLEKLARDVPEAGLQFQEMRILIREKDTSSPTADHLISLAATPRSKIPPQIQSLVDSIKPVPRHQLPPGFTSGTSATTISFNPTLYLPWLASQCLAQNCTLSRALITHITAAASLHHSGSPADVVVNCTGLSSLTLGGIEDENLFPARGQSVLVRSEPGYIVSSSGTDEGESESANIITRAGGGGTFLGGCLQFDNWDGNVDPRLASRMLRRCVEVCPELVGKGQGTEGLSVIRYGVGLRPLRRGGVRIDAVEVEGVKVVNCYGHGGAGYQTSWGSAEEVRKLVGRALERTNGVGHD